MGSRSTASRLATAVNDDQLNTVDAFFTMFQWKFTPDLKHRSLRGFHTAPVQYARILHVIDFCCVGARRLVSTRVVRRLQRWVVASSVDKRACARSESAFSFPRKAFQCTEQTSAPNTSHANHCLQSPPRVWKAAFSAKLFKGRIWKFPLMLLTRVIYMFGTTSLLLAARCPTEATKQRSFDSMPVVMFASTDNQVQRSHQWSWDDEQTTNNVTYAVVS